MVAMDRNIKEYLRPVVTREDVLALKEAAKQVYVSPMVIKYIVEIVTATAIILTFCWAVLAAVLPFTASAVLMPSPRSQLCNS